MMGVSREIKSKPCMPTDVANPLIEWSLFQHARDNVVRNREQCTFDEFVETLGKHVVTNTKDTHMFCTASFKAESEDFAPAMKNIWVNGEVVDSQLLLDEHGRRQVGRLASNVKSISCLVLDYDGGESISNVQNRLSAYKHYGYTSFSHGKNGVDKFRVILPLVVPITPAHLYPRKKEMLEIFRGCDKSTLSVARCFYVPSCTEENKEQSMAWLNAVDALFDWRMIPVNAYDNDISVNAPLRAPKAGSGRILYETMDIVQFFKDRGLYVRSNGNGKHEVICPKSNEHSNGDVSGTVIYEGGMGEWPVFYCSHTHDFTTRDFWAHFKMQEGGRCFDDYCDRGEVIALRALKEESDEKLIAVFGRGFL